MSEHHERIGIVRSYLHDPRDPARVVADAALFIGLLGMMIPFGLHDLHSYEINVYEWVLAFLSLVAVAGIVVDLWKPQITPWPFAVAAFVWAAQATYAALLPDAITAARIGLCLTFAGYAILSAGAWRLSVKHSKHELRS